MKQINSNTNAKLQTALMIQKTNQMPKVMKVIEKKFKELGINERDLTYLLRERRISIEPDSDRFIVKKDTKELFEVVVSYVKIGSGLIFDCEVADE